MTLRDQLRSSSAVKEVIQVRPTLLWTCPGCRTQNEETFDVFHIKVECAYCGHKTFLRSATE